MPPNQSYIVGICGGSASGKTYLLNKISQSFDKELITIVSLDNYYKPFAEQTQDAEGQVNFDHPDALHLQQFYLDLKKIISGESVTLKEYTFNNPSAPEVWITYKPAPLIIVEGLFVYYLAQVRDLIDLKIFVDAEEHIKLARRLKRDNQERGYSIESILAEYQVHVAPMYKQFVEPTRQFCDIVVQNNYPGHVQALDVIVNHLKVQMK